MFVYFFCTFLFVLLLLANWVLKNNAFELVSFWFLVFILISISSLRYGVGIDYASYESMFDSIRLNDMSFKIEPFTYWVVYLAELFGFDNKFIFSIYSALTILFLAILLRRESNRSTLSLFLFFLLGIYYFSTFNAVRQWLAISMVMLGSSYYLGGRKGAALALLLLAPAVHLSSVFFLTVFPFLLVRWRVTGLFFSTLLGLCALALFGFLITFTKYDIYLTTLRFQESGRISLLIPYFCFILVVPLISGYFKNNTLSISKVFMINMCFLSFGLVVGLLVIGVDFLTVMRVNSYFIVQFLILLPWLIDKIRPHSLRMILLLVIVFVAIFYNAHLLIVKGGSYMLTPYKTWI